MTSNKITNNMEWTFLEVELLKEGLRQVNNKYQDKVVLFTRAFHGMKTQAQVREKCKELLGAVPHNEFTDEERAFRMKNTVERCMAKFPGRHPPSSWAKKKQRREPVRPSTKYSTLEKEYMATHTGAQCHAHFGTRTVKAWDTARSRFNKS